MTPREVAPGLWHWQAEHPEWQQESEWPKLVSSCALQSGDDLLLFDPIGVPAELRERATAIVLTAPWHERDTERLVDQLGLPVHAARPDSGQDLIDLFGVDPSRVEGFVSSDLRWLVHEGGGEWHEVSADDPPPFGLEAFAGRTRNDLVYWAPTARAVISGDTLSDFGDGLQIRDEWLAATVRREDVVARLRPLLDRPVDIVLPAHGAPADRAALERTLT